MTILYPSSFKKHCKDWIICLTPCLSIGEADYPLTKFYRQLNSWQAKLPFRVALKYRAISFAWSLVWFTFASWPVKATICLHHKMNSHLSGMTETRPTNFTRSTTLMVFLCMGDAERNDWVKLKPLRQKKLSPPIGDRHLSLGNIGETERDKRWWGIWSMWPSNSPQDICLQANVHDVHVYRYADQSFSFYLGTMTGIQT